MNNRGRTQHKLSAVEKCAARLSTKVAHGKEAYVRALSTKVAHGNERVNFFVLVAKEAEKLPHLKVTQQLKYLLNYVIISFLCKIPDIMFKPFTIYLFQDVCIGVLEPTSSDHNATYNPNPGLL